MADLDNLERIAKALERIATALEKKPVINSGPYVGDVPPYRPQPYLPPPPVWRTTDNTNG